MKFETPVRVNAEDVKRLSKGLHEWFVKRYGEDKKVSIHMVTWGGFLEVNAIAVADFIQAYAIEALRCEDEGEREAAIRAIRAIADTIGAGSEFCVEPDENMRLVCDSATFPVDEQKINLYAEGSVAVVVGHKSRLALRDCTDNIIVLSGNSQDLVAGNKSEGNLIICTGNNNMIAGNDNRIILVGQNNEVQGTNSVISFDGCARIFSYNYYHFQE
jgi:hypothetical protein